MRERGGFQRGLELINRSSELGLGWIPLDAIGQRGGASGRRRALSPGM
jgi:hypothetical protein